MTTKPTSLQREVCVLFNGAMILRIDADGKKQTRRAVRAGKGRHSFADCPYGLPGTRLIVKEAAWMWCHKKRDGLTPTGRPKWRYIPVGRHVIYAAQHPARPDGRIDDNPEHVWRLKVGRFLPRWASRYFLTVTDVGIEPLHDITAADAEAEGIYRLPSPASGWHWQAGTAIGYASPIEAFQALWTHINGCESWAANPLVWKISFESQK
jgi:hypothetical protein